MTSFDIDIFQGSSLNLGLSAKDSSGEFLNLSGYSARGYVRYNYGSTGILLDLNPQVDTSFVSGLINVSLAPDETSGLPITKAVYDIEVSNASNYTFKVLRGYANIYPEATF